MESRNYICITSVLPNAPVACILSIGFMMACRTDLCLTLVFSLTEVPAVAEVDGFPIKVSLSHDGSSSDRASRSQED